MATQVFTTMEASPGDPLHDLLCKAAYWAQTLSESNGGTVPTAIYPNMSASPGDSLQTLAAKIVYWLEGAAGGGASGSGVTNLALGGAQPPVDGSVATKIVYDTTGKNFWYNTGTIGAPTWVAL